MLKAIILVSMAAILYTISILSEKIKKNLEAWMLAVFACGFLCDLGGTILMAALSGTVFPAKPHTFFGYSALLIMAIHLLWAFQAVRGSENQKKRFSRFSLIAWFVWVSAFLSGIPIRSI